MADNTTDIVSLADVPIGGSAVVKGFDEGVQARRFVEMGFVPGTTVTVLRSAPLGDPIEYAVMGGRIAMRRSDASVILVKESF
jgi:Fe2+ transport system protein FeoA